LDKDKIKKHLKSSYPAERENKPRSDFQAVNKFKERKDHKEQKGRKAGVDFLARAKVKRRSKRRELHI
jgi:hypothetical protein